MRDVVYVVLPVAIFVLAGAYVRGCAAVLDQEVAAGPPRGEVGHDDAGIVT